MLSDKKYGLSVNLMATKVMPHLIPQTVNPSLNLEQFQVLLEVLQDMLEQIDRNQRNKLKLDNLSLPSPERHRPLRHQYSSDNMHVPPFNIPNLRIEQRKTSSAEDMQRKNSTGGILSGSWWFGAPSSPDSNFLRVANAFPNRRLSDNTLMTPKIRIAPSCASSPGGTPGGGLPIRRHSSIGPQERRGSTVNLSPPTVGFTVVFNKKFYRRELQAKNERKLTHKWGKVHFFSLGTFKRVCARTWLAWQPYVPTETFGSEFSVLFPPPLLSKIAPRMNSVFVSHCVFYTGCSIIMLKYFNRVFS